MCWEDPHLAPGDNPKSGVLGILGGPVLLRYKGHALLGAVDRQVLAYREKMEKSSGT